MGDPVVAYLLVVGRVNLVAFQGDQDVEAYRDEETSLDVGVDDVQDLQVVNFAFACLELAGRLHALVGLDKDYEEMEIAQGIEMVVPWGWEPVEVALGCFVATD